MHKRKHQAGRRCGSTATAQRHQFSVPKITKGLTAAALLICGSPQLNRPAAPDLTISSILTPNGARLSRRVKADGDLRKGAPAASGRDRQRGCRVEQEGRTLM